jgi:hypothetical protein
MPKLTEEDVQLILEGAVLKKLQKPEAFAWTKAIARDVLPVGVFDFFSKKLHDNKYKMAMKIYAKLMRENRLAPPKFSYNPEDRDPMTHRQRVYTAARITGVDPKGFARLFSDLIDDYKDQFKDDAELNKIKGLAGMQ